MIKALFLVSLSLMPCVTAYATTLREVVKPTLIAPSASIIDERCVKDQLCLKKVTEAKILLTAIYHSFNQMIYREDSVALKLISPKFRSLINQSAQELRRHAIGDAEQVVSFGIQNFQSINAEKKLRLKIYTILFTEGNFFFAEAYVTFIQLNYSDKWQLESYEVVKR